MLSLKRAAWLGLLATILLLIWRNVGIDTALLPRLPYLYEVVVSIAGAEVLPSRATAPGLLALIGSLSALLPALGWLALALLLAPVGATSGAGRGLAVSPAPASAARPMVPPLPADLRDNAMSPAVPLFAALAGPEPAQLALALGGPSAIGLRLAAA